MSMFDTDDFLTHGARHVEVTVSGCGGEFCPGPCPDDSTPALWWDGEEPFLCTACRSQEVTTVRVLMSNDRADEWEAGA